MKKFYALRTKVALYGFLICWIIIAMMFFAYRTSTGIYAYSLEGLTKSIDKNSQSPDIARYSASTQDLDIGRVLDIAQGSANMQSKNFAPNKYILQNIDIQDSKALDISCYSKDNGHYMSDIDKIDGLGDLTILMYHNVLKDDKKQSVYCINQNALRQDFEYLKVNGYNIISCAQLFECVETLTPLPEKAVIITFDDGYLNNVKYALPLLEEYEYSGLFSVVGDYTLLDKSNPKVGGDFVYLSWQDISELSKNPYAEIALHSYSLHNLRPRLGASRLKGESVEEYKKLISDDTLKLMNKLYELGLDGNFARIYTYPYGKYTDLSQQVLKSLGIEMTLTCNEGTNYIESAEDLQLLKRINRDATKSSLEYFFKKYSVK